MENPLTILLSLKTPTGYDVIGEYELGPDQDAAYALFDSLAGNPKLDEQALLHVDLIEAPPVLAEKVRSKCCTLDELTANTRLIVREIFRQKNLRSLDEL